MRPKKYRRERNFKQPDTFMLVKLDINNNPKFCPVFKYRNLDKGLKEMDYYQKKYRCSVSVALMSGRFCLESHTLIYEKK